MKKINFNNSLETFLIFDIILVLLFLFFLILTIVFYFITWPLFLLFLIGDLLFIYAVFIEPMFLRVKRYKIDLNDKYSRSLKIVFLSDFHVGGKFSRLVFSKIIQKVKSLKANMIILGGDYVVWRKKEVEKLEFLKALEADYGKYFVLGNHDYLDDPEFVIQKISEFGYKNIDNKCLELVFEGKKLNLCGVDDVDSGFPSIDYDLLTQKLKILVTHNPDELLNLKDGDFDVVMAGHTHNLQINLPFLDRFFLPNKIKQRLRFGLKKIGRTFFVVSGGLGEVGIRARLFTPPEITFITINF